MIIGGKIGEMQIIEISNDGVIWILLYFIYKKIYY